MQPIILIAEDDALQSALMRAALERRGYQADIVSNGLAAIRRLRTQHYDVALLDYQMPGVDGLATARLLHDLMPAAQRPRLIAVTAAPEGLSGQGEAGEDAPFDAIVSKSVGLPALLTVIDSHLTSTAQGNTAGLSAEAGHADRLAWSRLGRACSAGIPAFAVAASLLLALFVGLVLLRQLDQTTQSARQTSLVSTNTAALVGAVQDAEVSQRSFLATGSPVEKEQFVADMQRVDQSLVAATPLNATGLPGLEAGPQGLVEGKIKSLAEEAAHWRTGAPGTQDISRSAETGRDASEQLREWAAAVVAVAQQAVLAGLSGIRQNVQLILTALSLGVCYALWNAITAIKRRFQAASGLSLGTGTLDKLAVAPPLAAPIRRLAAQSP